MAEAGFYWCGKTPEDDTVACFTCHKKLDNWKRTDNPWTEHMKHSSECAFIKLGLPKTHLTDVGISHNIYSDDEMNESGDALSALVSIPLIFTFFFQHKVNQKEKIRTPTSHYIDRPKRWRKRRPPKIDHRTLARNTSNYRKLIMMGSYWWARMVLVRMKCHRQTATQWQPKKIIG